jgi:hypothetical protein
MTAKQARTGAIGGLASVVLLTCAACGAGGSEPLGGFAGKDIKPVSQVAPPTSMLGLTVAREDVSKTVKDVEQTYVDALSVYSLRRGDALQATLQISRVEGDHADTTSPRFRSSVVNQLGATTPQLVRLSGTDVYLTTGTSQRLAVWFRGKYFFVLATRADYEQPRTLLRRVLSVKP